VGPATLFEVTQARNQLVGAASALATAKNNLVLTTAVLSYYTGELDPHSMTMVCDRSSTLDPRPSTLDPGPSTSRQAGRNISPGLARR